MSVDALESRIRELEKALSAYSQELRLAHRYIQTDAASSLTKSRIVLEKLLVQVYTAEMGQEPRKPLLGDMLVDNQFTRRIARRILSRMNAIRDMGNLGPHGEAVEPSDAERVLDDLCEVLEWYLRRYPVGDPAVSETQTARMDDRERTAIIRLVTQLGDRRLLTAKECKIPRCDMIQSAQKIRNAITDALLGLENDSASRRPLIDIRIACQTFQKFMEENSGEGKFQGEPEEFFTELGELRDTTGHCLAELSRLNGIDVDRSLRHLLPGPAGHGA
jgi:hypothetical protein